MDAALQSVTKGRKKWHEKNFYEHQEISKQRRGILPASEHLYVGPNTKNTCIKKGVTVKQCTQSFRNVWISD